MARFFMVFLILLSLPTLFIFVVGLALLDEFDGREKQIPWVFGIITIFCWFLVYQIQRKLAQVRAGEQEESLAAETVEELREKLDREIAAKQEALKKGALDAANEHERKIKELELKLRQIGA